MVRQLDRRSPKIQNGGRSPQPQQDPRDRHAQQLQGLRGGLAVPPGLAHEPRAQVRPLVTRRRPLSSKCDVSLS